MKLHVASLTILFLALALVPTFAKAEVIYSNGPINGTVDAWTINFGYVVSDTFYFPDWGTVSSFGFGVWESPGDTLSSVDWSITSMENGGTVYGSGTAGVSQTFISVNQFGYDIAQVTVGGLDVNLGPAGTYWLNLQNAVSAQGNPVFWDENSGPSLASESVVGTIASEAFSISGSYVPEPSSILLFSSGMLGLAGLARRKFFR